MFETSYTPAVREAAMAPALPVRADDVELSDAELEHVVGGLARVWHEALPALAATARGLGAADALAL